MHLVNTNPLLFWCPNKDCDIIEITDKNAVKGKC